MDIRLLIQGTPNPNALKFVLNVPVKTSGNRTFKSADECTDTPLAGQIFSVNSAVKEVYFFDNYITVTQNGEADWDDLEDKIKDTIVTNIEQHSPDFASEAPKAATTKTPAQETPEMAQINEILDQTVRPALQMDGGDLQLVEYNNQVLKIFYQGACGSCPSATMGTLKAIENILKDQFNPEIIVEMADVY